MQDLSCFTHCRIGEVDLGVLYPKTVGGRLVTVSSAHIDVAFAIKPYQANGLTLFNWDTETL